MKAPVSNWKAKIEDLGPNSYKGYEDLEEKGYCYFLSGKRGELRLNKSFFDDAFKYDGFEQAKNISVPTLVVHGTEDKSVPVEHSGKIAEILPNGELYIIEGADHRFSDLDDYEEMTDVIVEFIKDNLSP